MEIRSYCKYNQKIKRPWKHATFFLHYLPKLYIRWNDVVCLLNSNLERLFVFLDETSVLSWCHQVYCNIFLHFIVKLLLPVTNSA